MKLDCRNFRGEKPCDPVQRDSSYEGCKDCPYYQKMGKRILIIKLSKMGDVLRTTPLLYGLKKKFPQSFIVWLTEKNAKPLLETNPLIDKVMIYNLDSLLGLQVEKFDLLINLDKMYHATALAEKINSDEKLGFGLSRYGTLYPLNKSAEYAYKLGLSNDLKFKKNKKTYQEIIFKICSLKYNKEPYILELTKEDRKKAQDFLSTNKIKKDHLIIGFNTGSGSDFANKSWSEEKFARLAKKLVSLYQAKIILLGSSIDREKNIRIKNLFQVDSGTPAGGASLIDASPNTCGDRTGDYPVRYFSALIEKCNLIISGDTLGMHIAIALKVPVVALFGSTSPQEIELYNRGIKIVTPIKCAPCYKKECDKRPNCMDEIREDEVMMAIKRLLTLFPPGQNQRR